MPEPRLPLLPPDADAEIRSLRLNQIPMRREYAAVMFPLLSDTGLHEFTGGGPPSSVEALAELYAFRETRRSPDGGELWLNWMLWDRVQRAAIGYTQATVGTEQAYVAWVIGTRWQGRGYASEAAAALVKWLISLCTCELRACVNPAHMASRRVAEHAGLRVTGEVVDGEDVWSYRAL